MRNFFRLDNLKRRLSQLFFLAIIGEWSFYGIFRCPFAVPYLGCGQCPVIQCPGRSLWLWGWVAILTSGLLFGRAFCGWACPGGLVAELLTAISLFRVRVQSSIARNAAHLKLATLLASLYAFFMLNNPRWAIPIRTGEFLTSVSLTFEHANQLWLYKTFFILAIFFLGGIIIPRIWCRFLCPTGGLLSLCNRFALVRVKVNGACNGCGNCRPTCPMDTTPREANCINCGECLTTCQQEAVYYSAINRSNRTCFNLYRN